MKSKVDYSIYLCTDRDLMSCATIEESVEKALIGGATLVQLREKNCSSKEFYELGMRVKRITQRFNVPLIINDRIDIALAIDADGVHIGQDDIALSVARQILGNDKIIGVSARALSEAVRAEALGADYLGVGAMFSTQTKDDAKIVTRDELMRIRSTCSIPIVVIGGINEKTLPTFEGIAIDGIAVISAIVAQDDIIAATRNLRKIFNKQKTYQSNAIINDIECAIFDLDGTILDSTDVWERIDIEFLQKRGLTTPESYIDDMNAKSFLEVAEYTAKFFNLPETPEELLKEWFEMAIDEYSGKIKLKRGAKDYLLSLQSKGIRLALATSLIPQFFMPSLINNEIYDIFEVITHGGEVKRGKEFPDIYLLTMERLGANPSNCIVFEDVPTAMRTAKLIGAKVCGIYDKSSLSLIEDALSVVDCYAMDYSKAPILYK